MFTYAQKMLSHQDEFALGAKKEQVRSWSEQTVRYVLVLGCCCILSSIGSSRLPAQFRDELNNCAGKGPHDPATPSPERLRVTFGTRGPRSLLWEDIVFIPRRIGLRLAPSTLGVAQRASEFYSLVMLNKRQQILGARALNFLQSVRQLMAAPGPSWLLKYWKPSLDRWHHREFTGRVTCSAPCR